jgi:hypothetical protein
MKLTSKLRRESVLAIKGFDNSNLLSVDWLSFPSCCFSTFIGRTTLLLYRSASTELRLVGKGQPSLGVLVDRKHGGLRNVSHERASIVASYFPVGLV